MSYSVNVHSARTDEASLNAEPIQQVAALCHRKGKDGVEVLLVTSSRGRWILPKGWPMKGLTDAEAAKQEAWEEAGLEKGKPEKTPIGNYAATKRFDNGATAECKVDVYAIAVKELTKSYPEADQRKRKWLSPKKAAKLVEEPQLKTLLRNFQS